jgi:hypothetical protein
MNPKDLKNIKWAMIFFATVFFVVDLIFLFFTEELFTIINQLGEMVKINKPIEMPSEKFYLILTNSMMLGITYISARIAMNAKENINLLVVLMLIKLISSITGLILFFLPEGNFGYLIIFIADFPLFLISYYFYNKLRKGYKMFT